MNEPDPVPPVRLGSSASPRRPRSQKFWTFVVSVVKAFGVVSVRLSKILMVPLFSATNTRPSAAKRIAVGLVSPDQTVVSWKPEGAMLAVATGSPLALVAHLSPAAALASASRKRCWHGADCPVGGWAARAPGATAPARV